jgi:Ca2+/Na+ antiporter
MKKIFDYTYYRIAKFYFKSDGLEAFTSILTISIIKGLYLMGLFFIIKDSFFYNKGGRIVGLLEKSVLILILFFLYLYNKKKYQNKYLILRDKWINEEKNKKRVNGFLVILFVLSPLFLIVFIASYFGKTNF